MPQRGECRPHRPGGPVTASGSPEATLGTRPRLGDLHRFRHVFPVTARRIRAVVCGNRLIDGVCESAGQMETISTLGGRVLSDMFCRVLGRGVRLGQLLDGELPGLSIVGEQFKDLVDA